MKGSTISTLFIFIVWLSGRVYETYMFYGSIVDFNEMLVNLLMIFEISTNL